MTSASPQSTARFLVVAAALPVLFTVVAVIAQLILLPRLPDPSATKWAFDGTATQFGPPWVAPLMTALVGIGVPALIVVSALPMLRQGAGGPSRFVGALSPAIALFIAVLTTWSTVIQVDVADAHDTRMSPAVVLVPLVAALAVGAAAWFALPRTDPSAFGSPASARPLTSSERAVWTGRATLSPLGFGLVVLTTVGACAAAFFASDDASWIAVVVGALALVALLTTTTFRVRVDGTGLSVVSVFGLPRFHVPLSDVASVEVISVRPMSQFGGWGLRRVPGAFGVVLRSGDAIQVTRASGPRFVVTVTDASTGASLLQGMADRATRR
ncbi:hypothetical protein [Actinocorallia sp. A-T 12471]|uniref:hypothetical protein n=1 Tax=Actinocorallia sp. A-T 12471 TaxID=3089813 RepID=UPI0029CFC96B|nr:hypothetical protein [Actinocorallia sp. A-T 12471]MDX6742247.1 hypothetical protein [Actinocorallia sp. A-T 12471]